MLREDGPTQSGLATPPLALNCVYVNFLLYRCDHLKECLAGGDEAQRQETSRHLALLEALRSPFKSVKVALLQLFTCLMNSRLDSKGFALLL